MNKFIKNKEKIIEWLQNNTFTGGKYELLEDEKYGYIINCFGFVTITESNLKKLPVKFNIIKGEFSIRNTKLQSLEGCPEIVEKDFNCSNNNLKSLEFCPKKIGGDFNCSNNILTSLVGMPPILYGIVDCSKNELKSLKGCVGVVHKSFKCSENKLKNLEHGPKIIKRGYDARNNDLQTLLFIPEEAMFFDSRHNLELDKEHQKQFREYELKEVQKFYQIRNNYKKLNKQLEIKNINHRKIKI